MERARVLWAMLCLGSPWQSWRALLRQFYSWRRRRPGRKRSPRMPTGTHVGSYGTRNTNCIRERQP